METRKHQRVSTGLDGSKCVICNDSVGQVFFSGSPEGARMIKAELEKRHTVEREEPHLWQNVVEQDTENCLHCGHDKDHPLHFDFAQTKEMLRFLLDDYNERKNGMELHDSGWKHVELPTQKDFTNVKFYWVCALSGLGIGFGATTLFYNLIGAN